jgi:acyl-CoA reductase-like NAD-dependent aldehyde dehydrogenase
LSTQVLVTGCHRLDLQRFRMAEPLDAILTRLAAGGSRLASLPAAARAQLARDTARAVAVAADRWVEAAVAIKTEGGSPADPAHASVVAEETATGPLATMRLLLTTCRVWKEIGRYGRPRPVRLPRVIHAAAGADGPASFVALDVLPEPRLLDGAIFQGHRAVVRCVNPGGFDAFEESWRAEAAGRPRSGGVAAVLGAGNVTGLAPADAICQIFEHGRAAIVKLHPLHAPLEAVYRDAFAPLLAAELLAFTSGGPELARGLCDSPAVTQIHLTGGRAAFDALVWGDGGPRPPGASPVLAKPVTCELGNVTPWVLVPGRYTPRQLQFQADLVAASIANNTSFNCIATKCLVTARQWPQREAFLGLVAKRLESLPSRRAWYPGAVAAWEEATGRTAPADGTLPCMVVTGIDPREDRRLLDREWFAPVAAEVPLDATDIEAFCTAAAAFTRSLPGSLAAAVTIPATLDARDRRRAELLAEHLRYGVVAVNTWAALAYAVASVPWGGYPGGTLAEPASGIGHVHDPLLLPLVHNTIFRAPLTTRMTPAWVPWHRSGRQLGRGLLDAYAAIAAGRSGLWPLAKMLPAVLAG